MAVLNDDQQELCNLTLSDDVILGIGISKYLPEKGVVLGRVSNTEPQEGCLDVDEIYIKLYIGIHVWSLLPSLWYSLLW